MALTKVTSASVKDGELVNADLHSAANIVGTKLADDTITEVKLDVSNAPSAGTFLQYKDNSDQLTWAQASSPEVYGFNTDANGILQVTTTNGGADNIAAATYAAFEDVVFAATGITFSLDATTGNLIATI